MFESLMASLQSLQGLPAYALVFGILVGSGFGLPMNEDLLLVTAAALTLSGVMAPWPLIAVAWCGLVIADGLIFHWGRLFGTRLLEHRWLAHAIAPRRLAAMQSFMQRRGAFAIFAARFMPGLRSAVYLAAGSLRVPYRQQFLYDGLAAAIELPLLVFAVRYVGGRWDELVPYWPWLLAALVVLAIAAWAVRRWAR
ncbi:MAG TPA: DedA family protein [Ramlibacter sp.]|jgi:membrane protein DedA with SNARE-associated domain|nr:DedA family protein [Ramlibacter sp.]